MIFPARFHYTYLIVSFFPTFSLSKNLRGNFSGKTKILCATLWKEVLHLRWNERHLSAYFETLITQL